MNTPSIYKGTDCWVVPYITRSGRVLAPRFYSKEEALEFVNSKKWRDR